MSACVQQGNRGPIFTSSWRWLKWCVCRRIKWKPIRHAMQSKLYILDPAVYLRSSPTCHLLHPPSHPIPPTACPPHLPINSTFVVSNIFQVRMENADLSAIHNTCQASWLVCAERKINVTNDRYEAQKYQSCAALYYPRQSKMAAKMACIYCHK